jgi:hypothetical protein
MSLWICRLQQLLLQPHEEGSKKGVSDELGDAGAVPMQKRSVGRVKVQGEPRIMVCCDFSVLGFKGFDLSWCAFFWSSAEAEDDVEADPASQQQPLCRRHQHCSLRF